MTQIETVQEAFIDRLDKDPLIDFDKQAEITQRAAELWENREKVTGRVEFIEAPGSGLFPDGKDAWAVKSEDKVNAGFPYIWVPAVDTVDKLLAIVTRGLELKKEGKNSVLVTNFPMEQRSEREVKDESGKLHQVEGNPAKGIEMALLRGVVNFLNQGFPRGLMHVDGHGLGFESLAGEYGFPVFTMTAMPKLITSAVNHGMVQNVRTVSVGGDVGGVMMMNMVAEFASNFGLTGVETIYGEKRAEEVFTSWGRGRINGAQVFFGDDIISSGKTVFQEVLKTAFEAGACNAVVFVTHADLVEHTLKNLDDCPGDVKLVVGDTFPVRPEVAGAVAVNQRLLIVPVFESVMKAAEMDAANLLTDVFTNPETQAELLRQTGLGIFPPYVERYRTVADMLK